MKHLKHIITACLLIATASAGFAQGFKLNGEVSGLPEGTKVYLRMSKPDVTTDSAIVAGGKFSMTGKVKGPAEQLGLYTKNYTNYVFFWAENKPISIKVKAGEFKKGEIKGSLTQDEDSRLMALTQPASDMEDSLSNVYRKTKDVEAQKLLANKIREARQNRMQVEQNFIRQHPNSIVAMNSLDVYASTWGKPIVLDLYKGMGSAIKLTDQGRNVADFITLNKTFKIGDKYADFEQMSSTGKNVRLSAIKGKYVLVDFWASWCGPCREENPSLAKSYQAFKDKGFTVLGVSLDDNKASWLKAIKEDKLAWENVCDLKGDKNRAALIYGISGIPDNFLIDSKGIIIAKNLRGKDLDDKLEELLK